jgi:beta-lactamase regulating signal transducer with metallopeptidase domain
MVATVEFHEIARLSALRIVESLAQGTAVTIFAGLFLRIRGGKNASTKFAVWFLALMAIAAFPIFSFLLPQHLAVLKTGQPHAVVTLPESWALYLFIAWAVIAISALIQLGRAMWRLRILRARCTPLDPAIASHLQGMLELNPIKRTIMLCMSDQVRVPTAVGLWKPAIVFPRWATRELSLDELNQIMLHELAHLRRRDDWTNLAQQTVKALFFFHPAVWWIEKQISLEREIACDDAVLEATESPRAYAECLAHLAEKSFVRRSLALAQAALGKMRHTSLRVAQILDASRGTNREKHSTGKLKPAALVAGFAMICAVCVSHEPNLIAFQTPASHVESAHAASLPGSGQMAEHSIDAGINSMVPVTPANFRANNIQRRPVVRHATVRSSAKKPHGNSIVPYRLVEFNFTDAEQLPFTDAVFVVIQTKAATSPQPPAVQIQLLILHPAADQIPPKKT